MKSVKLNGKSIYRMTANAAYIINEKDIKFINGVGVAKVVMDLLVYDESAKEVCYCLVDEKFNEIMKEDKNNEAVLDLMCLPRNLNNVRCGENDFIVTVRDKYYPINKKFHHVKLIDNMPTMINDNLPEPEFTYNYETIICDNKLYDVKTSKYISRRYSTLTPIQPRFKNDFRYLVTDNIKVKSEDNDMSLEDVFRFIINENEEIISGIYSSLDLDWYTNLNSCDYEQIRKQREEELLTRLNNSNNIIKSLIKK